MSEMDTNFEAKATITKLELIASLDYASLAQEIALSIFASESRCAVLMNEFSSDPPMHDNTTFLGLIDSELNAVRWLEENANMLGIGSLLRDLNHYGRKLHKTTSSSTFKKVVQKLIFNKKVFAACSWTLMAVFFYFVKSLAIEVKEHTNDYTKMKHILSAFLQGMRKPVNYHASMLEAVWVPIGEVNCRIKLTKTQIQTFPRLRFPGEFPETFESITKEIVVALICQDWNLPGLRDMLYGFPNYPPSNYNPLLLDHFLVKVHDECCAAAANERFPAFRNQLNMFLKLFYKSPDIRFHYEIKRKFIQDMLCQHSWGIDGEADWQVMYAFFYNIYELTNQIRDEPLTELDEKVALCKTLVDVTYELFFERRETTTLPDYEQLLI